MGSIRFTPGEKLFGQYTVQREVGADAGLVVVLVVDEEDGLEKALKVFPLAAQDREAVEKRVRHEARLLAGLKHPNIIGCYGLRRDERFLAVVLEHAGGGTLRDRIESQGKADAARAAAWGGEICSALALLHERGGGHRNLNPESVFLVGGKAVIGGFGFARVGPAVPADPAEQDVPPEYSAPELSGGRYDHRSDVYSAALVLLELLLGRHPMPGELDAAGVREWHSRGEAARSVPEGLPSGLTETLRKALAADPGERIPSAESFLEMLRREGAGTVAPAPRPRAPGGAQAGRLVTGVHRIELAEIPAGTFRMGSPENENGRYGDEELHEVAITRPFLLGRVPVTQAQWKAVTGRESPSRFKGRDLPVEEVSWFDAVRFCNLLSQEEGLRPAYALRGELVAWDRGADGYRLPTEAEWEYACRAGTNGPFSFGDCLSAEDANYDGNYPLEGCPEGTYRERTTPAGSLRANPWGLHDMHGNVWEWCWDWKGPYPKGPVADPSGPEAASIRAVHRSMRGGSWARDARYCRSAFRLFFPPGNRDGDFGFRLCRSPG